MLITIEKFIIMKCDTKDTATNILLKEKKVSKQATERISAKIRILYV